MVQHTAYNTSYESLSPSEWCHARDAHRARVLPWIQDRTERAGVAEKHPVYDFLFTYYSFRPAHLFRWSPGTNVTLEDAQYEELDWPEDFILSDRGYVIPSHLFPTHRRNYLAWALRYLTKTGQRPATFHCYGLHEWAMLYNPDNIRHSHVPLRISLDTIADVVNESQLRCTHYDAYRFFTPPAMPRNRTALDRQSTTHNDQPGCIHVTMDLYKFAFKIAPWCPSELIADAFLLAVAAREIDMRASPYDLQHYGLAPIPIEEAAGRLEYIQAQQQLSEAAKPLRERLLAVYTTLVKTEL